MCGATAAGNPLVSTLTAPDGTWTLKNVPVGASIPLVVLVSMVPALSPFILLGLLVWWILRRRKRKAAEEDDDTAPGLAP